MSNIEPVTWADTQGGPGTISAIPLHGRTVLVVSQTEEIHEELGWFLAALRRIAPDAARPRQEIPSARIPRSRLPTTGTLTPSSAMRGHGMTRATE